MSEGVDPTAAFQPQLGHSDRVWHRWLLATLVGILLGVIGLVLVAVLSGHRYRASAWIRISQQQPYLAFPSPDDFDRYVQNEMQLAEIPVALQSVLSDPTIARFPEIANQKDPVGWLAENLSVRQVGESELVVIEFTGPDAKRSARIVNEVVDVYFRLTSQDETRRINRVIELLDQEAARRADRIAAIRESMKVFTAVNSMVPVDLHGYTLTEMARDIVWAEAERRSLEAELSTYVKPNETGDESSAERFAEREPAIIRIQATIAGLRAKEDLLRRHYKSKATELRRAKPHWDKGKLELEFRRDELAREEKVFERISARGLLLRTEMRAPARVELVRRATPPRTPLPLRERVARLACQDMKRAFFCGLSLLFVTGIWVGYVQPRSTPFGRGGYVRPSAHDVHTHDKVQILIEIDDWPGRAGTGWRRWGTATLMGILSAVIGIVLVAAIEGQQYSASSWIRIQHPLPYVVEPLNQDFDGYARRQRQLITSRVILAKVISHRQIAAHTEIANRQDPISWLARNLSVDRQGRSDLFVVELKGSDPNRTAEIVNEVISCYFRLQSHDEIQAANKEIHLLDRAASLRLDRVASLRGNLKALVETHVPLQGLDERSLDALAKEIKAVEDQRLELEAELEADPTPIRAKIAGLRVKEDFLRQSHEREKNQFQTSMTKRTEHSLEIERLKAELACEYDMFERISDRALLLRTELGRSSAVQLLQRATPSLVPLPLLESIGRMSHLEMIAAFQCALLISFATGVWAGYRRPHGSRRMTVVAADNQ